MHEIRGGIGRETTREVQGTRIEGSHPGETPVETEGTIGTDEMIEIELVAEVPQVTEIDIMSVTEAETDWTTGIDQVETLSATGM